MLSSPFLPFFDQAKVFVISWLSRCVFSFKGCLHLVHSVSPTFWINNIGSHRLSNHV